MFPWFTILFLIVRLKVLEPSFGGPLGGYETSVFSGIKLRLSEARPGEADGQVCGASEKMRANAHRGAFSFATFLVAHTKEKLKMGEQGAQPPAVLKRC